MFSTWPARAAVMRRARLYCTHRNHPYRNHSPLTHTSTSDNGAMKTRITKFSACCNILVIDYYFLFYSYSSQEIEFHVYVFSCCIKFLSRKMYFGLSTRSLSTYCYVLTDSTHLVLVFCFMLYCNCNNTELIRN